MLRVKYVGGKHRCAFVTFTEETEKKFEQIRKTLEKLGWRVDVCDYAGIIPVYDRENYEEFMEDWKYAKEVAKRG